MHYTVADMPIYEYACQFCGYGLEARQKFSDPPLHQCPACEKDGLERLISETSFALKGSGWYADGYGPGGKTEEKAPADASTKPAVPSAGVASSPEVSKSKSKGKGEASTSSVSPTSATSAKSD